MKRRRNAKTKRGRPTRYGPEIHRRLIDAIAGGASLNTAARACALAPASFHEWLALYPDLANDYAEAKKKRLRALEEFWVEQIPTDWKAARDYLRVKAPKEFAETLRLHVEREIDSVLDALREAFKDEPALYERALHAVVGRGDPQPEEGHGATGAEVPAPA
jgi:hypothetical protein